MLTATFGISLGVYADFSIETGVTGNIFSDKSGNSVTLSSGTGDSSVVYDYKIMNYEQNTVIYSGSVEGKENGTVIELPDLGYGAFYLNAVKSGTDESVTVPYSCIMERTDGVLNDRMGVSVHFSWSWDEIKGSEVARKAGFAYVRDELTWAWAEPSKGYIYFPQRHFNIINAIRAEGMEPQYNLLYGNKLYTKTDRTFPETDEEQAAFVNYAYNVVKMSNGKIKYWRLWNEPNADPEVSGLWVNTEERAISYMKLLIKVYSKIKPEFPDVQIGAFGTTDLGWSADFIKWACDWAVENGIDPMQYIDYVSVHDYTNVNSTTKDIEALGKNLRAVVNSYPGGSEKEIWCNEYGYYDNTATNLTDGKTPTVKAAHTVVKAASMLANGFTDKNFIYVLADKGQDTTYSENVFGITERYNAPVGYAAKPAYVSATAFNSLTAGYKKCGTTEYSTSKNVKQYDFFDTVDCKNVSMLWSKSGTYDIYYTYTEGDIVFRDMYGNIITPGVSGTYGAYVSKPTDGRYKITVTGTPIYIITPGEVKGNAKITTVDEENNIFALSGHMLVPGKAVVTVYPKDKLPEDLAPTSDMVYCTQTDTNENGYFEIKFPITRKYSDFTAVVSGTEMQEKLLINFSSSGVIENVVSITKNGEEVNKLDSISEDDTLTVSARVKDSDTLKNVSIIYAVYDANGNLIDCKIPELEKDEDYLKASGEVKFNKTGVKYIKVYMWDMKEIYPLGKYKTID